MLQIKNIFTARREKEAMGFQKMWLLVMILAAIAATPAIAEAKPGCQERCGHLSIPYPFGTRKDCYLNESFLITCNHSKPHLRKSDIDVLNISVDGQLRISYPVAFDCHKAHNRSGNRTTKLDQELWLSRFPLSSTRNKFTAIGCDTGATIQGFHGQRYATGCMSLCQSMDDVIDGSCLGVGCCQTSIPKGVMDFYISIESYYNYTLLPESRNLSKCSYAFVVEEDYYKFSKIDLDNLRGVSRFPVLLDWAVGDTPCQQAQKNKTGYICQNNSVCYDSDNGPGYRCKCSNGFQGNPYLPNGCEGINECDSADLNECTHSCTNNITGGYTCHCPKGYHGDGRKSGEGCKKKSWRAVTLGVGVPILVLGCFWLYWTIKRRNLSKYKEKIYKQNGGLMLEIELGKQNGSMETVKIFTIEELKKATNDFDESTIIGRGGFGIVYKGILPQNKMIAIKKTAIIDQSQIEQFVNEVIVVSQINHRNVVRLLGCCLETEVPLLVYEFITNGTLFHHIHEVGEESTIPWEIRLRIAKEVAGALSYLHSAASIPIIHRDVKSTNILLDDNFIAKVSDFGASRLVPLDKTQLTTMVQGTLGYLDPEYFHTSHLSEKSDVYSFGVVLVELLTSRKALSFDKPEKERSLATYFISSMKENQLFQILDHQIVNEGNIEQLREVAKLAQSCLRLNGEERPTMKEIVIELEGLMKVEKHHWVGALEVNPEETKDLLSESMSFTSTRTTTGYDSLKNQVVIALDDGR